MSDQMKDAFKKAGFKESDKPNLPPPKEDRKMIAFYTEKKALREELITTRAQQWADEFVPDTRNLKSKQNLSSAQIRRFYGEVLSIEEKMKTTQFEIVRPQIKMLKSKAAYAANPNNRKIPDSFKNFIFTMVDSVDKAEDFKAFKTVFEAVIGYFYGKGVK